MKKSFYLPLLLLFLLPFISYAQKNKKSKDLEVRQLGNFSKVSIEGNMELYLYPGETNEITAKSRKKIDWSQFITVINGDELSISYQPDALKQADDKIHLHLYYQELEALNLQGRFWVSSEMPHTGKQLKIDGEGIIKGNLAVNVEQLEVQIEGIAKMKVSGTTDYTKLDLKGMGKIDGADLVAQSASTHVEGWGKTYIHVEEDYVGSIEGVGSINYTGNPRSRKIRNDGLAVVRRF